MMRSGYAQQSCALLHLHTVLDHVFLLQHADVLEDLDLASEDLLAHLQFVLVLGLDDIDIGFVLVFPLFQFALSLRFFLLELLPKVDNLELSLIRKLAYVVEELPNLHMLSLHSFFFFFS